jgi:hypothetical protein
MSVLRAVQDMTERIVDNNADARRDFLRRGRSQTAGRLSPGRQDKLVGNRARNLGTLTFYPSTKKRMCA